MNCPTKCSGSNPGRQSRLTAGQIKKVPEEVGKRADYRCSYCGCVYDFKGSVFGYLDNGVMGEGWHSQRFPFPK